MKEIKTLYLVLSLLFIVNTKGIAQYNVGHDDGFAFAKVGLPGIGVNLPVELLWFKAECSQSAVNVKWATASEKDNENFTIERSNDGNEFISIGKLAGAEKSNKTQYYSFTDNPADNAVVYYRLKQTDSNGQNNYSEIISIDCIDKKTQGIQVYPNPVTDEFTIEVESNEVLNIEIINSEGAVVGKDSFTQKTTVQTTQYSSGIYLLKITYGDKYEYKKISIY